MHFSLFSARRDVWHVCYNFPIYQGRGSLSPMKHLVLYILSVLLKFSTKIKMKRRRWDVAGTFWSDTRKELREPRILEIIGRTSRKSSAKLGRIHLFRITLILQAWCFIQAHSVPVQSRVIPTWLPSVLFNFETEWEMQEGAPPSLCLVLQVFTPLRVLYQVAARGRGCQCWMGRDTLHVPMNKLHLDFISFIT